MDPNQDKPTLDTVKREVDAMSDEEVRAAADLLLLKAKRADELKIGDRCWYYHDARSTFVDVVEVKRYLEGEPHEFCIYKVVEVISKRTVETAHRMNLYKCPEEADKLLAQLQTHKTRLEDYISDLKYRRRDDPAYIPDPERDEI